MRCPACGSENLQGTDECETCQSPLAHVHEGATQNDIAKIMKDSIGKVSVPTPISVGPDVSAFEVIQKMKKSRSACALVVENRVLLGIFTERDALQKLSDPNMDLHDIEIQHLMTRSPEMLKESDSIAFALNKMAVGTFRHVPFEKADGSFGVLSAPDILKHFF